MHSFAIVAHRRTGSNHLVSLLNSHPHLACYGEIFRNCYDVARFLPGLEGDFADVDARIERPAQFLDAIHAQVPEGNSGWGFKLMPFQVPDGGEAILSQKVDRAIILRRDNRLAQYSCDLIAAEAEQKSSEMGAGEKPRQVKFSARDFNEFCREVDSDYDKMRAALEYGDKPVLEIEYMELQDSDLPERLCSFLQVEPAPLKSDHQKRINPVVLDRFKNYKFARNYLINNGLNEWAVEARADKGTGS